VKNSVWPKKKKKKISPYSTGALLNMCT
jgi:hypothetical protein